MNDFLKNLRSAQADKQRSGKKRKNYDTSYHYAAQSQHPRFQSFSGAGRNPRNTGAHSRKREIEEMPTQQNDSAMSLLAEAVDNLSSLVDVLAKNQEYVIAVQEKANDTLERQAAAIEEIVGYLNFVTDGYPEESFEKEEVYVEPAPRVAKPVKKQVKAKAKVKKEQPIEQGRKVLKRKKSGESVGVVAATSPDSKLLSREAIMDIIYGMREKGATYDDVATQLISLGQPTFSGRGEWHAQTIHRLCTKK
ncbi:MAG: hypothetical protein KAR45_02550 [Desulfobacteraceae bacterium]|nr:hypothetical protein [Desulfobacteraceae bacterium]